MQKCNYPEPETYQDYYFQHGNVYGPQKQHWKPFMAGSAQYQLEVVIASSPYVCQWTDKRQKAEQNRDPSDEMSEELNRPPGHPSCNTSNF